MSRAPLAGADLYDWIALRRVSDGGVAKLGDWWLENGRQVPGYVTDALTALGERVLVVLIDPDPKAGGMARAALTDAGVARYEQLCQQRQVALQVPVPQFGATCDRLSLDHADSAGPRQVTLTDGGGTPTATGPTL